MLHYSRRIKELATHDIEINETEHNIKKNIQIRIEGSKENSPLAKN